MFPGNNIIYSTISFYTLLVIFFSLCIATFLRHPRTCLSITRECRQEEISLWKSFSSVSILILGKRYTGKIKEGEKKHRGVVYVRVLVLAVSLRFREMACAWYESVVTRDTVSENHHFERCCILQAVQPTQTHGRWRRLTPSYSPTFQSHWSRRLYLWNTTTPTGPDHCQVCIGCPWILER